MKAREVIPDASPLENDISRFSNGRPKPILNTEPLLESADSLIEAALAQKHPELHVVRAPEGYRLRGVSTLVDSQGNVVQSWVKTTKEADAALAVLDAFKAAVSASPLPVAKFIAPPKTIDPNLAVVIPIGDMHMGMMAWGAETGEDWDIKIARQNNITAMRKLIALSPQSETCVIINLGDGLHADGHSATTTAGTRVDVDSRWPKMLQVFLETMNECVELAAAKHRKVIVLHNSGNHDLHGAYMIALCQAAHFRNNPRVEVSTSPSKFKYFEHGKCLLGTTHGDTLKFDRLPGVMAVDQSEAWGRCEVSRYWYLGHFHTQKVMEIGGCTIETFRTLAAKDFWHCASGYRANRSMVCDVWHKNYGRLLRHEISLEQLGT